MAKLINLVGKRFGRLEIKSRAPNHKTPNGTFKTMWNCICDCGKETIVDSSNLTRTDHKAVKSCGCLRLEAVASKDWLGVEFRRIQRGNFKRSKKFSMRLEEFSDLILKNCFYCGQKPKTKSHVGGHVRNGIDRIDNLKDYVSGNVVTCCWSCNRMKGSMDQKDFLDKCSKISKFQSQLGDKTS